MFEQLTPAMRSVMAELEAIDARDRDDGTPRMERLRQIPPETGQFIAIMAALAPVGAMVEIGTSAGYSTLWLSLAARATGRTLSTYEVLSAKVALARSTFARAGVEDVVHLVEGDYRSQPVEEPIGFCFLDAEKEVYEDCYELLIPRLVPGGLLVADNAINHAVALASFLDRALHDERVDATIATVGKGELLCRKI
jgi:predicted O-methyltransferase YrrM